MTFVKHENFPVLAADLIRRVCREENSEPILQLPQEIYGENVRPDEWLDCLGKQTKSHRPFILTMDEGIKANMLSVKAMRDSGCSFVCLTRQWADEPIWSIAWRILKCWPEVVSRAEAAHRQGIQCRIDVSLKGKIKPFNL